MFHRVERLNELIKQEVGNIIQKELHQKSYLITLTEVETSEDLRCAVIKISVLPYDKEKEAMDNLKNNVSRVQKIVNKKISMKFVPRISFIIDKGVKSADAVDVILEKIKEEK